MAYRVVCISATDGAAGEEIAPLIAERLRFPLINEQVVARAAEQAGVGPHVVAEVERRKSLVSRVLEQINASGMSAVGGYAPPMLDPGPADDTLRDLIRSVIEEIAARGNVVIMAHAASHALASRQDTLRVFITASAEVRAERFEAAQQVDGKEAEKAVARGDTNRADYLKRFYRISSEVPTHYDLVVNTDRITAEEAAELIARAAA
jgi:Cytidylate kinase-like family